MKHEIGALKPDNLKEYWPGQYDCFSHFEYLSGVPHALFLITTRKENRNINACFQSWSAFSGDSGGFFAVMPGIGKGSHTYANILREGEFCVNFMSADYYEACQKTIKHNDDEIDELNAAGLTAEPAKTVAAPRIAEAFMSFECRLEKDMDLSGKGLTALIIGRVLHAAVDETHRGNDGSCRDFMFYIHAPKDPQTGEGEEKGAVARLTVVRDE